MEKLDEIHRGVEALSHAPRGPVGRSDSGFSADVIVGEGHETVPIEGLRVPRGQGDRLEIPQMSQDYLIIPECAASADTVLSWPIFEKSFASDVLIQHVWQRHHGDYFPSAEVIESGVDKSGIPGLVDSFLQNAHTKNPVCDVAELVQLGEQASHMGNGWESPSCLLLIACALGSVARAFDDTLQEYLDHIDRGGQANGSEACSVGAQGDELAAGERFYRLACQRLGCVGHNMLGSQAHFFAGVYLMYTFRPLEAWDQFYQASSFYQFYQRSVYGSDHVVRLEQINSRQRRLEQSLYWSCFKSEVEMRVELPLSQSTIASFEYPSMFPSPPTPPPPTPTATDASVNEESPWYRVIDAEYGVDVRQLGQSNGLFDLPGASTGVQAVQSPYNEEESWFYYLTEVALRRISNRIVNTFYRCYRDSWLQAERWIDVALELDEQINTWSAHLPAAMQTFDASPLSLLKLPRFTGSVGSSRESVSHELSWCTENRLLEMRSWLYQPFLYCAVHQPWGKDTEDQSFFTPAGHSPEFLNLVAAGIDVNFRILHWRALFHRHHGIWFDVRSVITAVIILCGLAKSGNTHVPTCLFLRVTDDAGYCARNHQLTCISFDTIFRRLKYWEEESPDVRHSRLILEELVREVREGIL